MRRNFRGMTVKIEVKNPDGVSRGVRSLVIDGKPVEGALAPLDRIRDGSKIVATLG
jgi:N,N'-diacetylchitobiose phosphorylase